MYNIYTYSDGRYPVIDIYVMNNKYSLYSSTCKCMQVLFTNNNKSIFVWYAHMPKVIHLFLLWREIQLHLPLNIPM